MQMENMPRRRAWETYILDPEEAAAVVAAVRAYADAAEDGSAEWEAIRPVFGLFVGEVPEIRLQVREAE